MLATSTTLFGSRTRRTVVVLAALGLVFSAPVGMIARADEGASGAADNPAYAQAAHSDQDASRPAVELPYTKLQVVYVKTDAAGAQTGVYVVNAFDADEDATVRDLGTYESVVNLSDTQKLDGASGTVRFDVERDELFLYEGTLDAATQTPWTFSVAYYLNGAPIEPSELAGASGRVRIELTIAHNASYKGPYAASYLLQVTASLKNTMASHINAPQATQAQSGDSTQLTYLVFPEEAASVTYAVEARVSDFTFDGWQIVGVPLAMSVDVDGTTFEQATSDATKLEDGISSANQGAGSVSQGAQSLSDSISNTLVKDAETLAEGSSAFAVGMAKSAADSRYAAQTTDVASAQAAYEQALAGYVQAYVACALYGGDPAADETVLAAQQALQEATTAFVTARATVAGHTSVAEALEEAARTYASIDAALQGLVNRASDTSLYQLEEGAAVLADGASQLHAGTQTLATDTSDLAGKIESEVRAGIDAYLNPVFTPVDFVNGSADVESVQFVYMTAGISKEKPKVDPTAQTPAERSHDDQTFFEKLRALF